MKNRPAFDQIFMNLALDLAKRSHCVKAQVGAVLTKDTRIISIGYNGPPAGTHNCDEEFPIEGCPRDTKGSCSLALHAEENAILFAKRDLAGCEIWVTHFPCPNCAAKIIQTGISTVHCPEQSDDFLSRWGDKIQVSQDMFEQAGVAVDWLPLTQG